MPSTTTTPRRFAYMASALLLTAGLAAPAYGAAPPGRTGGKIVVGVDTDPTELDPAGNMLSFTAISVANAIYEPLFDVPFGKTPTPLLAESISEAPDRLSWTLKVRPGVIFQDGTKLDAAAVVFNLQRQKVSQLNSNAMSPITGIDVVDPMTVKLSVAKPYVAMPYLLSRGANIGVMISPAVVKSRAKDLARNPAGAGTGPYLFKEWVQGDHLTVLRNAKYWGARKPKLDEIRFKVIPDENARLAALRAGDIQSMTSVVPENATKAASAGLSVVVPPFAGYGIVLFNNSKAPFDDVRVRRAAALALDSKSLAAFLKDPNYDKAGLGLWPKGNPWYAAPEQSFGYDLAAAKKLVAAYEKEVGPIKFTYLSGGNSVQGTDTARLIAKFWKDAGMDVELSLVTDANSLVLAVVFGTYDAAGFVAGLAADPDPTAYPVLHSSSSFNFSKYKSPAMDAALDEGRSNPNPAARKVAYAKVQQLFRRDVPFLIGSPATVRVISDKKLCGIEPSGFFPAQTAGYC